MEWIWLLLIVIVVIVDISTSNVLLSWLAIGFIVALFASQYVDFQYQLLIAAVLGIFFIIIGNNVSRKYIKKNIKNEPILVDKYIGKSFLAEEEIGPVTQHKVNGIYWMLINEGPVIHVGEHFKVIEIRENKLVVVGEEK